MQVYISWQNINFTRRIYVYLSCGAHIVCDGMSTTLRQTSSSRRSTLQWSTYGCRVFSVVGPMTRNSLTDSLCDPSLSIDSFRRQLKTFLFSN